MTPAQRHDAYRAAELASDNIRQAQIAAIEGVFQAALTGLLAHRPFVAGPIGVETLAAAEQERIAELRCVRDDAIRQAEDDHQQRIADAAVRCGISTER